VIEGEWQGRVARVWHALRDRAHCPDVVQRPVPGHVDSPCGLAQPPVVPHLGTVPPSLGYEPNDVRLRVPGRAVRLADQHSESLMLYSCLVSSSLSGPVSPANPLASRPDRRGQARMNLTCPDARRQPPARAAHRMRTLDHADSGGKRPGSRFMNGRSASRR
jgi:hypothetical protein